MTLVGGDHRVHLLVAGGGADSDSQSEDRAGEKRKKVGFHGKIATNGIIDRSAVTFAHDKIHAAED